MIDVVNEENFVVFAAKHYDNPQCYDTDEFMDDLKRFKYIKRLFNRYDETGDLRERLILNHILILYNLFGDNATIMLFVKLNGYYPFLKPFLVLINRMPDRVQGVITSDNIVYNSDIAMDTNVVEMLRNI
tara:strand:- start:17374 stop:17763 length:390 start_codon:yes stop_codon:yes gene_type:complete